MIHFSRVHDISILLGEESAAWPGDPPYERELISAIAKGGVSDVSRLTMSAHCGTHVDTPAHFIGGGFASPAAPAAASRWRGRMSVRTSWLPTD